MTTPGRVGAGAARGILAASLAIPAVGLFKRPGEWDIGPAFYLAAMPLVLLFTAILAGPGAFLLSWVHAVRMENWAPKARTRGHLRRVGVLLGLPLGVANLALVFGAMGLLGGRNHVPILDLAPWLIPALAGGAGLGWGVTLGLTPGKKAPPRRRTLPPIPRRNGPPFFDNRARRAS